MDQFLTKSLFLSGTNCVKRFYLETHARDLNSAPTAGDVARMKMGIRLGAMARELFPDGVTVESQGFDAESAAEATQEALRSGAKTLFEATFVHERFAVRCDALERTPLGWRLIEVKSSTKVKDDHVLDLAFQWFVLESAGFDVSEAAVCRVDSSQKRTSEPLGVRELFAVEDVTRAVQDALPAVKEFAQALLVIHDNDEAPEVAVNLHCVSPSKCPFYDHCHEGIDQGHVVYLPGVRRESVIRFYEAGFDNVRELGQQFKLTPQQTRAVESLRTNRPNWDPALLDRLEEIQFPACFVDFEATNPALPLFEGMRPYESFPFQWSNHVLLTPFGEPKHYEFLHRDPSDPRARFAGTLLDSLRDAKTVVFYSSYELSTVKALVEAGIPAAGELLAIFKSKGLDLLQVIRDCVYFPAFQGSFSIKKVLPAVVPDLDYGHLTIKDGDTAAVEYLRMVFEAGSADEFEMLADDLLAYCKQDTLAMVRLYQELLRLTRDKGEDIVSK